MKSKTTLLASLGLVAAPVIWGFAFVVVKSSLDIIPPLYMMAFRFTIAFIGLILIYFKRLGEIDKTYVKEGVVLGIFLYLSYLFQTYGCKYTTAGKNAFLTTIYVVLVPYFNWIICKKRPKAYTVAAAVAAIFGIGLLSLDGNLAINIGDALTIVCGVGYAIHMVYVNKYTQNHDPIILTLLQIGVTAALSWLTAPVLDGGFPHSSLTPEGIYSMLYLGLLSTMLAYLLQNIGQKHTKPATAALLLSLESVFGMLFSVIFLHEVLTAKMIVGCVIIFASIVFSELKN